MKLVHLIAAARPNFMKIAPLYLALKREKWCKPVLIHTGQHYDANMSDHFFKDFGLNEPDINLNVGRGSHSEQTAGVMVAYEKLCLANPPDLIIVPGDVNSTLACTLVGKKLNLRVAHLESGLRSGDRAMPEEINRIVTDVLADYLWTPSLDAHENLAKEGIDSERIVFVGNIMIDSFEMLREKINLSNAAVDLGVKGTKYAVLTLHRPSNVDSKVHLEELCTLITKIADKVAVVFPVHPRTKKSLESFDKYQSLKAYKNVFLTEPLGYSNFMNILKDAQVVVTDSGGIQEETTYLGIPCLTLRTTTERPITIIEGTNKLVTSDSLLGELDKILGGKFKSAKIPKYWDGKTAARVVIEIRKIFNIGENK